MPLGAKSSHDQPTNNGSAPPKGRAKACTACRQVKLRCNAKENYPAPCSRCRLQRLECKLDSSFKRVPARRQLEEVSDRLDSLQRSLGLDQHATTAVQTSGAPSDGSLRSNSAEESLQNFQWNVKQGISAPSPFGALPTRVSSNTLSTPEPHGSVGTWLNLGDQRERGTWTIGDVTIESDTAYDLFQHFNDCHFRHMPALEPCTSIQDLYQSSPLLFWSIILVSCRMSATHPGLYTKLRPHHQALLSTRIMDVPHSLRTLHAMLLLIVWPYPLRSQMDDPTWMYCGMAVNMAILMGLHRPGHQHEFGRPLFPVQGSNYIRNITWLSLFCVTVSVGSWLGFPPLLSSASYLDVVSLICKDRSIPRLLCARAELYREVVRYTTTLDAPLDFRTRHSLVKIFEQDIDRVRKTYEDVWSDDLYVELLGAKLNLYGLALISPERVDGNQDQAETPPATLREILQQSLAAALHLTHIIRNMKVSSRHESGVSVLSQQVSEGADYIYQLGHYPKHVFRTVAFACFFLLWFLRIDVQASDSDKELAREYVSTTHRLYKSYTDSPEHQRFAKFIEIIGRMPIPVGKGPALRINSRLGSSFMFEVMTDTVYFREGAHQSPATAIEPPQLSFFVASQDNHTMSREEKIRDRTIMEAERSIEARREIEAERNMIPERIEQSIESPFDTNNLFQAVQEFQEVQPNWNFPWGVWDNAALDDMAMDMDFSQVSYNNFGQASQFTQ